VSLLTGQTAVITGGAQGLGFAIAQRFVDEGARVVLGDVNLEATQSAAAQLGGDEVAIAVRCDVTSGDDVDALIGAAVDELAFDVDQLDLALETADEVTSAALETTISKLTTVRPHSVVVDRVRRAVAAGAETYETVADKLGTSARTLRRQLEREGQSLRAIADELRRERADELLAAALPIKEVAFALGFSEPSAFSRAYKRWTGKAPRLGRVK